MLLYNKPGTHSLSLPLRCTYHTVSEETRKHMQARGEYSSTAHARTHTLESITWSLIWCKSAHNCGILSCSFIHFHSQKVWFAFVNNISSSNDNKTLKQTKEKKRKKQWLYLTAQLDQRAEGELGGLFAAAQRKDTKHNPDIVYPVSDVKATYCRVQCWTLNLQRGPLKCVHISVSWHYLSSDSLLALHRVTAVDIATG